MMKAKITVTAKKTWTETYPDNDFSDAVIDQNFWGQTFDQNEFMKKAKIKIERVIKE